VAPKRFNLTPATPAAPTHVRVPLELWREMTVAVARYAHVRTLHPHPPTFDLAVDNEIIAAEQKKAASPPSPEVIQ